MSGPSSYTAFEGEKRLVAGPSWTVAVAVKAALAKGGCNILTFDDRTGRLVDLDLRGADAEITARLQPEPEPTASDLENLVRLPGRPKLGVIPREVTLLPRHWDWLAEQPGGASVTLRKLVEAARLADTGQAEVRRSQEAADRFMRAMLGDQPGYEEASRALYAGIGPLFAQLVRDWPADLRDYAAKLAEGAWGLA